MKKILVIDDDVEIGLMIKMFLEFKGFAVFVAENPEQAREILKNNTINLVIMDMLLSGSSGIDLIAGFKKDSAIAHIPVMMMSAHPEAGKICTKAGADDYIPKPFDAADLLLKSITLINRDGKADGVKN